MFKHTQVHVHEYVVCFGISEVEGVDMELLCIGGFINEAGWKEVKAQEAPVFWSLHKNSLCITNMKRWGKIFQEAWD